MRRSEQGFTLVELLISMTLLGILSASAALLLVSASRRSDDVQEQAAQQSEVRGAIDTMVRELRQAYSGDSTPALETANGTQLMFLSPDRAEPFHLRRISYRLTGGVLERAIAVSTNADGPPWTIPSLPSYTPLVTSVVSPSVFTYQDVNGSSTSDRAAIRTVGLALAVTTKTSQGRSVNYQTSVDLRATR